MPLRIELAMTFTGFPLYDQTMRTPAFAAWASGFSKLEPDAMALQVCFSATMDGAIRGRTEENLGRRCASALAPIASHVPPRFSSEIAW
ncbi:hypothetical protein MPC4_170111 [Methylocella tundrae]|uniref:Uncharacterized protein n=1 Tax=Methylocella tundrae TaxID=227605 RepID=A0A8B6M5G5_METTU|nr:hypothetical protein MPC4_170111 [Methylocella tundrae]